MEIQSSDKVIDVLSIDKMVKSFGKKRAVDELSMKIGAGEAVAFIGQNGAEIDDDARDCGIDEDR